MKKVLLLGLALLFISSAVSAQQLALYVDTARETWCTTATNPMVYLFAYLDEGFQCVETNTVLMTVPSVGDPYPTIPEEEYDALAAIYNVDVASPIMGGFPNSDLGVCYNACYSDWYWVVRARIYVYITDPIVIQIRPFQGPPVQPFPLLLSCLGEELQAYALTNLYINSCGPVAVEESSWGAIKNMYE